jgi:hypothetical protein
VGSRIVDTGPLTLTTADEASSTSGPLAFATSASLHCHSTHLWDARSNTPSNDAIKENKETERE